MCEDKYRSEFLLRLYDQCWASINVRITGMWQCVGVLAGAFVVLALAEKEFVPLDIAVAIIILLAGWLLWGLEDASYWYNRNLAIVANIEKQFLHRSDKGRIHPYMAEHRPSKMITHLKIQYCLGIAITIVFVLYHFTERIIPGFGVALTWDNLDLKRAIPYVVVVFVAISLRVLRKSNAKKYKEFLEKAPGEWAEQRTEVNC
jgi:hypothetical protein